MHAEPEPPRLRTTLVVGAVGILAAALFVRRAERLPAIIGSQALIFSCLTISLVLLTGLSGQVSIMQMSFAGLGAVILGKVATGMPSASGWRWPPWRRAPWACWSPCP